MATYNVFIQDGNAHTVTELGPVTGESITEVLEAACAVYGRPVPPMAMGVRKAKAAPLDPQRRRDRLEGALAPLKVKKASAPILEESFDEEIHSVREAS